MESSKSGFAAAGLAVIPTRQCLSRTTGDPTLVASKMASGVEGAFGDTGRACFRGPSNLSIGEGGGPG